ncbi:organelle RRM domain-containing protein 2, mitochondrial-like [Lolium rigidum]|uniref:organelle RRM domain-containing protein 2, mitochondrial-like n=1 Tax=Lolium rigidum TaxID=89674 RepID=UPI001F5DD260|nr:organelle RRM domain-containing protein 2, mitochondrial-like [Lolium rigidum]
MAAAAAVARSGLRRMFSISEFATPSPRMFSIPAFAPPNPPTPPPKADPSSNLFVSGLSKRTTTDGLREAFAKFGEVVQARVVTDRVTGFSKGFGFVRYATVEDATRGIEGMDGKFLDGWVIFAEYARPRPPMGEPTSQSQQSWGPPSGSWGSR